MNVAKRALLWAKQNGKRLAAVGATSLALAVPMAHADTVATTFDLTAIEADAAGAVTAISTINTNTLLVASAVFSVLLGLFAYKLLKKAL